MATEKDFGANRNTVVLEGIYKGIVGKIEEAKAGLGKELGYVSSQQVSTYEALMEGIRDGVDSLLSELRYLSQQNSAIFDYREESAKQAQDEQLARLEEVKVEVGARAEESARGLTQTLEEKFAALDEKIAGVKEELLAAVSSAVDYDLIAEKVADRLNPVSEEPAENEETVTEVEEPAQETETIDPVSEDNFDYDVLAEKIASVLPEIDYDAIAEKVSAIIPEINYDTIYERVAAAAPVTDYDALADRVIAELPQTDYDLIAEKVAERLNPVSEEPAENEETVEPAAETEETSVEASEEVSEEVAEETAVSPEEEAEALAERIAAKLPGIDYDTIAARVVAELPQTDYDAIAEKVAERLAAQAAEEVSEEATEETAVTPEEEAEALAERIAAKLPETDYDRASSLIAAGVVAMLPSGDNDALAEKITEQVTEKVEQALSEKFDVTVDEVGVAKLADAVTEALDYPAIAERIAELLHGDEKDLEQIEDSVPEAVPTEEAETEEVAEEPVEEEPVEEEKEVVEEPSEEPDGGEIAAAVAVAAQEEDLPEGVADTLNDPSMMVRYKRSFIAKVIQSEDDVKHYYSEMKNALMSYDRMRSQVAWSNDRFTVGRETLAKIGIRGKTLCLYLALNPDAFPITVYHQKFAGDTKMYEKTPMMVKIKSHVGLKRAIRLIDTLMEREQGVKTENYESVDYTKMYEYKSDEALLEEGLIKTALVEKVDLNF
ncbi:MAG: hypothetical protein ACI4NG_05420 [Candidatus Gallimonas sp.]